MIVQGQVVVADREVLTVDGDEVAAAARPAARRLWNRLESIPEGAEVFVNEELVGITPCEAPRPMAGQRFDLVFTKPGYENRVVSVSSATIGRLLRYSLVPIRRAVARDPEPEVLPTTPLPPPPPPPPPPRPTRRRDDTVREVVDPWE